MKRKARELFPEGFQGGESAKLKFVKGDYGDVETFTSAVKGHTRLFMLATGIKSMGKTKHTLGKIAYEAGVKQIVDISSFTVGYNRSGVISQAHTDGEERLRALAQERPEERFYVALRPGAFMTNHMWGDVHSIKNANVIQGAGAPDVKSAWVDSRDTGDVAATVLLDPLEKHGNAVYDIHPDVLTNEERARVFSKVLGREIRYKQAGIEELYEKMSKNAHGEHGEHLMIYDVIVLGNRPLALATPAITLLTKRPVRTLEQWIEDHKAAFSK